MASEKLVQNCEVRFSFQCPRRWDSLKETPEPNIRACDTCAKLVYFCATPADAQAHAQAGHCVAIEAPRAPGPYRPAGRLGELLVREGLLEVQTLRQAQEAQRKDGGLIGYHLIKSGAIEESRLTEFLSKQYGVPAINRKDFDIDREVLRLVRREVCEKHLVIPVSRTGDALIVAMADPSNIFATDDLKFLTGFNIETVVAPPAAIEEAIARYYAADEREVLMGIPDPGPEEVEYTPPPEVPAPPEPEPRPVSPEEEARVEALSQKHRVPRVNLDAYEVEPEVLRLLPREVCAAHQVIPVTRAGPALVVAVTDPADAATLDRLRALTGLQIEPVVASTEAVAAALGRYYPADLAALEEASRSGPVVRLIRKLLLQAIRKHATEVLVEPDAHGFRVLFRIEGIYQEELRPPRVLKEPFIASLKLMAGLDVSERKRPQEGRLRLDVGDGKAVEFVVRTTPVEHGEQARVTVVAA